MLKDEVIGGLDHKAHDLVGRVDDAQPIRAGGVVGLVEVLVDGLEEAALLVVIGDLGGGGLDRLDVAIDAALDVAPDVARVEGADDAGQLVGDVVFAVKLGILIDGDEDILREDVLDDHLAHVGHHQVGVDGFVAQLEEIRAPGGKRR